MWKGRSCNSKWGIRSGAQFEAMGVFLQEEGDRPWGELMISDVSRGRLCVALTEVPDGLSVFRPWAIQSLWATGPLSFNYGVWTSETQNETINCILRNRFQIISPLYHIHFPLFTYFFLFSCTISRERRGKKRERRNR